MCALQVSNDQTFHGLIGSCYFCVLAYIYFFLLRKLPQYHYLSNVTTVPSYLSWAHNHLCYVGSALRHPGHAIKCEDVKGLGCSVRLLCLLSDCSLWAAVLLHSRFCIRTPRPRERLWCSLLRWSG